MTRSAIPYVIYPCFHMVRISVSSSSLKALILTSGGFDKPNIGKERDVGGDKELTRFFSFILFCSSGFNRAWAFGRRFSTLATLQNFLDDVKLLRTGSRLQTQQQAVEVSEGMVCGRVNLDLGWSWG